MLYWLWSKTPGGRKLVSPPPRDNSVDDFIKNLRTPPPESIKFRNRTQIIQEQKKTVNNDIIKPEKNSYISWILSILGFIALVAFVVFAFNNGATIGGLIKGVFNYFYAWLILGALIAIISRK